MIVLGIETSCDETSASIVKDFKVLSNVVKTQSIHIEYGGVVPDLASKDHEKKILNVVNASLKEADVCLSDIDAVAVTYGSGLLGSLIVGLNFAKGLCVGLDVPLIGVSHLVGHLSSSFINKEIFYPHLSLIVSGGHTQIWLVKSSHEYNVIANTVDDAAGEAFDKGARILGLSYPGGPEIEKKSKNGDPDKYVFTIPEVKQNPLNFSFSGLKTALLYKKKELDQFKGYHISDLAASYQHAIIKTLLVKLERAIMEYKISNITIVGGVSANLYFRESAKDLEQKHNLRIIFPDMEYCTDNAAMIAMAGYLQLKDKKYSDLTIEANPNIVYN